MYLITPFMTNKISLKGEKKEGQSKNFRLRSSYKKRKTEKKRLRERGNDSHLNWFVRGPQKLLSTFCPKKEKKEGGTYLSSHIPKHRYKYTCVYVLNKDLFMSG